MFYFDLQYLVYLTLMSFHGPGVWIVEPLGAFYPSGKIYILLESHDCLAHVKKIFLVCKQVLAYVQQSKEMANAEQDKLERRIQEFRTQAELASLRALSHAETSTSSDGTLFVGSNSYKNIEALMQSAANGPVLIVLN